MLQKILILLAGLLSLNVSFAQSGNGVVPVEYLDLTASKLQKVNKLIQKKINRSLQRMAKLERTIARKLQKSDSLKAREVLKGQVFHESEDFSIVDSGSPYLASVDTVSSSLNFLLENVSVIQHTSKVKQKLSFAKAQSGDLQANLLKSEKINAFLKSRKQVLTEQLQGLGFVKNLKKVNQEVYYYNAQITEYTSLLKDYKKAERKALDVLRKSDIYKDFMRKNSMFASLFRLPSDPSDITGNTTFPGLQTREMVASYLEQRFSPVGAAGGTTAGERIGGAQNQLASLQAKFAQKGSSSSEEVADGFRINEQKTKRFLQRLQVAVDVQSVKGNTLLPKSSELGLSIGYKFSNGFVSGVGLAYRFSIGSRIKEFRLSSQALGLRAFMEYKLKKSFWAIAGFEMNYQTAFDRFPQLRSLGAWQQSGLVGVGKVVSLKTKILKQTKVQLLWDFLSYSHVPITQPIVFRVGYTL